MDTHSAPTLTARPYADERDLLAMTRLLIAGRARTDDWRYPHVGDLLWNFLLLTRHLPLPGHVRLWHDAAGGLVAYATLGEGPSFDCQTLPEHAWRGIEPEALAWAEGRLAALRAGGAAGWADPLGAIARRDDAQRIAFLEEHGFRQGDHVEVTLVRALDAPPPAPTVPAGYAIRALAGDDEIPARAEVERAVWGAWPDGQVTTDDYARLMTFPGYDRDLDVVAITPEGVIASYVLSWVDPVNRIGICGPVGTRAEHRRRGLARAALTESLRRMQARGMTRVAISTGESNTAARRLYETSGFAVASAYLDYARPA